MAPRISNSIPKVRNENIACSDQSKRETQLGTCQTSQLHGLWWNHLCSSVLAYAWLIVSLSMEHVTSLLGQSHSVPAAFFGACPAFLAFRVSWALRCYLVFLWNSTQWLLVTSTEDPTLQHISLICFLELWSKPPWHCNFSIVLCVCQSSTM